MLTSCRLKRWFRSSTIARPTPEITPEIPEDEEAKQRAKDKAIFKEELEKDFVKIAGATLVSTGVYTIVDATDRYSHLCDDPYIHFLST
jgi:hypothetical protein